MLFISTSFEREMHRVRVRPLLKFDSFTSEQAFHVGHPRLGHHKPEAASILFPRTGPASSEEVPLRRPKRSGPPAKPFELTGLVLDLDAYDSKYVRPFKDGDGASKKWLKPPELDGVLARMKSFKHTAAEEQARLRSVTADHSISRISPRDIFNYVLLGDPRSTPAPKVSRFANASPSIVSRRSRLVQLLHENGIPEYALEKPSTTIDFMLHRHTVSHRYTAEDDIDYFVERIRQCTSLDDLRRLLSATTQTETGCRAVSFAGTDIVDTISAISAESEMASILAFINNLMHVLNSHEVEIGRALWLRGLQSASLLMQLPALQQYLTYGNAAGYFTGNDEGSSFDWHILTWCLRNILQLMKDANLDENANWAASRAEIFTLLTGQAGVDVASGWCFEEAFQQHDVPVEFYDTFINILTELGCLRTIWHWAQRTILTDKSEESLVSASSLLCYGIYRYILNQNPDHVRSGKLNHTATGQYYTDCILDCQELAYMDKPVSESRLTERPAFATHWRNPPAIESIEPEFRSLVLQAFLHTDISLTMENLGLVLKHHSVRVMVGA